MVNWDVIKSKLKTGATQTATGFKKNMGDVKSYLTAPVGKGKKKQARWQEWGNIAGNMSAGIQESFDPLGGGYDMMGGGELVRGPPKHKKNPYKTPASSGKTIHIHIHK